MSRVQPRDPTQITAEDCATVTEWWVITTSGSSGRVVHIPDAALGDNTANDPDREPAAIPACDNMSHKADWLIKSTAILPPGFKPTCLDCRRKLCKWEAID